MTLIVRSDSTVIKPPTAADGYLSLTLTQRGDIVSSGGSSNEVIDDMNVLAVTSATTDSAWDIAVGAHHRSSVSVEVSCSATGLITALRLTRVSDGNCTVVASSGMFRKSQTVAITRQTGQTVNTWQSWVPGSLASAIEQTTNVNLPFWRGSGFGFTAISPRHVIGCEHIYYMPDTLTLGGVTRSLVDMEYVGPMNLYDNWSSDLLVGLYDGDFPSFAKVFSADLLTDYLPSLATHGVPAVVCNKFGQKLQRMTTGTIWANSKLAFAKINPSDDDIVGGDSGNPAFLVVDGEPVLIGTLTGGGGGSVTTIHNQITAINAAMTALGGGHQLTEFDLSEYPTY